MKVTVYVSILLALVLSTGLADEPAEAPEDSTSEPDLELTPEQPKLFGDPSARENGSVPLDSPPRLSGEWIEGDGVRVCDGYLTRFENEDYCAAEVPSDWQPFEFNGRTYYVQPLMDKGQ